jgi:hypothetical protein
MVAAILGPVASVVRGVGTLIVVAAIALTWSALARIGPLHTLGPAEPEPDLTE